MTNSRNLLLSSKVTFNPFSAQSFIYPNKVYRNYPIIWREFITAHELTPLALLVVGKPQCGKTETAHDIATR